MKVRAFDIDWDSDGEDTSHLPKEWYLEVDEGTNLDEDLADILSNEFDWTIKGCNYEVVE